MNVLRCQVELRKIVQVDIPEEKLEGQRIQTIAELVAREQYGYDYAAKILEVEAVHLEDGGPCSLCGGAKWTHGVRGHVYSAPLKQPHPAERGEGERGA